MNRRDFLALTKDTAIAVASLVTLHPIISLSCNTLPLKKNNNASSADFIGDLNYSENPTNQIAGWVCIKSGNPGKWAAIKY